MKILYIAGYARIGSTLLDSALGSHERIFSAGEMTHLFDDALAGSPCGCGAPIQDCPVWGAVLEDVGIAASDGAAITRACEHGSAALRSQNSRQAAYRDLWTRVLSSLDERADFDLLVDASKSMQFAARRLGQLRELHPEDVSVIHLTRDPRASLWSVRKGGNQIAASRQLKTISTLRTAVTWSAANVVAERSSRTVPRLHIRYEDLVNDPHSVLTRIGQLTNLSLDSVATSLTLRQELPTSHGIAGNRLRQSKKIRFRPDTDWRESATRSTLAAAYLTTPIARRYGYR